MRATAYDAEEHFHESCSKSKVQVNDELPPAPQARRHLLHAVPGVPRGALHPRLYAFARIRGLGMLMSRHQGVSKK
jgi:hypothetical protein